MPQCFTVHIDWHLSRSPMVVKQYVIWHERPYTQCIGMNREEARVKQLMQVTEQQDPIVSIPRPLPCRLKTSRAVKNAGVVERIAEAFGVRVEMIMLLWNDM